MTKFNPHYEPFGLRFQTEVKMLLKRNRSRWTELYQRIDGQELHSARYRLAMDLPHQSGRKLLIEKVARMEFLYGLAFNTLKGETKMAKKDEEIIYECRWFDNREPPKTRIQKTGHQTLGQAQMKGIEMSETFGYAAVAETRLFLVGTVPQEEILRRYEYIDGKEYEVNAEDFQAAKEAAIANAEKRLKTEVKEKKDMTSTQVAEASAGKSATKVPPAVAKNAKTTSKAAKPVKAAKAPAKAKKAAAAPKKATAKVEKTTFGAPGSVLAQFDAREGTFRAKCLQILCDNKGKMLPVKDVLKATYGSASEDNMGKLNMVLKGVTDMANANEIAWHLERGKDDKDSLTLGLKAGKA